jgi:hypothetical protein
MLRTCYQSRMRLWQGSDELVQGRWLRAPPGAKGIEGPHRITSAWWRDPHGPDPDIGEVFEPRLAYDKGANPAGYTGDHICGSKLAVASGGVHGRDTPVPLRADGVALCCWPPGGPPPPPQVRRPAGLAVGIPVRTFGGTGWSASVVSDLPPVDDLVVLCVAAFGDFGDPFDPAVAGFTRVLLQATGNLWVALFTKVSTGGEPFSYAVSSPGFGEMVGWKAVFEPHTLTGVGAVSAGSGSALTAVAPAFGFGSVLRVLTGVAFGTPTLTPADPLDTHLWVGGAIGPPNLSSWYRTIPAPGGQTGELDSSTPTAWLAFILELWLV